MSIVSTTAYPSRYADEDWMEEEVQAEATPAGKFYLEFKVLKAGVKRYIGAARRQRELAQLVGRVIHEKPAYERREKYYHIGNWTACASEYEDSVTMLSGLFDINEAESKLLVLEMLHEAGYVPDEEVTICFKPDVYDLKLVMNISNIIEARNALIAQALGLDEEIKVIVDMDLAFSVPLSVFSFEKIEACVYLLRQASLMAANTGKARMKPCDGSNPKYQMRTWLLRLGFIGDQYARPRRTLLGRLTGDGAFFSDDGKEKAAMKRKSKHMAG